MSRNNKVLVTGCLGYIGSVLIPYLKNLGYDCIGYDTGFFKDCLLYKSNDSITTIGDMRNFDPKILDGVSVVIHLAAISNDPFGDLEPEKIYYPIRDYTIKLAKMCKERGIKFIFPSSCSVYGKCETEMLNEDSPTFPQTPYSINKLQIEEDLEKISDRNFSPIALRLATIFGLSPRIRFDLVINMFIGMALTEQRIILNSDGLPWRPNVHILDVVKAFKQCIELDYSEGNLLIMNVGDDKNNYRVIDLANIVKEKVSGCKIQFLKDKPELDDTGLIKDKKVNDGVDTRTYKVSFQKIIKYLINYKCDWSVERGIEYTINELKRLNLKKSQFKSINFYRLQKIEYLHKNHYISDNLFWNN